MNPLENFVFIILFDQIKFLGKVCSVIKKINPDIRTEKYFDIQQLLNHDFSDQNKIIVLITENQCLTQFEDFDISPSLFKDIICIDTEETDLDLNTFFINRKLILTGLMPRVNDLILSYLPDNDFVPVNYKNLLIGKSYPCALFIKLKENKYIKILTEEQIIEKEFISKYLTKDIVYFYVRSSDYNNFSKQHFVKKQYLKNAKKKLMRQSMLLSLYIHMQKNLV